MITSRFAQRLRRLEEQMMPNAEPIVIDVVFVDAAKKRTGGFQVTIPMNGYATGSRRGGTAGDQK
jgi:hypothetical protein